MKKLSTNDQITIANLVREQLLDRVLDDIITDIALEIIDTPDADSRDRLYYLTKALKVVKDKLQDCVNETEF